MDRRRSLGALNNGLNANTNDLLNSLPPPQQELESKSQLQTLPFSYTKNNDSIEFPSATARKPASTVYQDLEQQDDDDMIISPVLPSEENKEKSLAGEAFENGEQLKSLSITQNGFIKIDNFNQYIANTTANNNSSGIEKKKLKLILSATDRLPQIYQKCRADEFKWRKDANPRRVLTKPSKPSLNDGYDNENGDYILYVNDILGNKEGQEYQILDILGQGTFGQVAKCLNLKSKELVAVKVIKNKPAYYNQSLVEVAILDLLNRQQDPHDQHHIARMRDTFVHRSHLCIAFEMLSLNLYELIKQSRFSGFSTNLVRVFMSQILDALTILGRAGIIHCDLKPENILLKTLNDPNIKVIDFGSACHEGQTLYTYIQSRFYRSPEVLLGLPYTSSIDMWSVGCIGAELFLGLPLFPGSSEYNQISRIVETLGVPPAHMIEKGKTAKNFFTRTNAKSDTPTSKNQYALKSLETYQKEQKLVETPSKRYLQGTLLEDIIMKHEGSARKSPASASSSSNDQQKAPTEPVDKQPRLIFIDFLRGLLSINPLERWSPQQAKLHPFITGEKWTGPYKPSFTSSKAPIAGAVAGYHPVPMDVSSTHPMAAHNVMNPSVINISKIPIQQQHVQPVQVAPNVAAAGGGAVRTSRPRANTISSSKVAVVPPTLQRLVAMQQAGGGATRNLKHRGQERWVEYDSGRTSASSTDSGKSSPLSGKRENREFDEKKSDDEKSKKSKSKSGTMDINTNPNARYSNNGGYVPVYSFDQSNVSAPSSGEAPNSGVTSLKGRTANGQSSATNPYSQNSPLMSIQVDGLAQNSSYLNDSTMSSPHSASAINIPNNSRQLYNGYGQQTHSSYFPSSPQQQGFNRGPSHQSGFSPSSPSGAFFQQQQRHIPNSPMEGSTVPMPSHHRVRSNSNLSIHLQRPSSAYSQYCTPIIGNGGSGGEIPYSPTTNLVVGSSPQVSSFGPDVQQQMNAYNRSYSDLDNIKSNQRNGLDEDSPTQHQRIRKLSINDPLASGKGGRREGMKIDTTKKNRTLSSSSSSLTPTQTLSFHHWKANSPSLQTTFSSGQLPFANNMPVTPTGPPMNYLANSELHPPNIINADDPERLKLREAERAMRGSLGN